MELIILGAGESGVGAAMLARRQGLEVFVSDLGKIQEKYRAELESHGIPHEEGQHSEARILEAAEVIKSPGIPDTAPLVRKLTEKGVPVISEIEFAARYTRGVLIGITGSNGKTTTSTLCHHILREGGLDVSLAGNVGVSFARQVALQDTPYYVLEISSFQLDGIRKFRSKVAMLLNITPDHLDRYEYRLENYIRSKFRIGMNQLPSDYFLYNGDDPNIGQYLAELGGPAQRIAIDKSGINGSRLTVEKNKYDLSRTALSGAHNAMNAAFAIRVAHLLGLPAEQIQAALESFQTVEHRLESFAVLEGVAYINDSKATNVDAVYYALEAMDQPVIWVVGGQDKGNDYGPLQSLVREKVKAIICLGLDNEKLRAAFADLNKPTVEARSAEAAAELAAQHSEAGDVVLLSPACASFDLFKNYEDRGRRFKAAVLGRQRAGKE